MDSEDWNYLVMDNGTLDVNQLVSRETLYIGRNGKAVERFTCKDKSKKGSYIFKPLTNTDTLGREVWAYREVLPLLPTRVPRLLAHAQHEDPNRFWAIYEDLGMLKHHGDRTTLLRAAGSIPLWHQLPLEVVPDGFQGHTPRIQEIWQQVVDSQHSGLLEQMLKGLDVPDKYTSQTLDMIDYFPTSFRSEISISHGDFHPLNLSMLGDELTVLDWEYVQQNSVYWDLYNLLDITSPRYRRPVLNPSLREEVLLTYMERRSQLGWDSESVDFQRNYYMYSLMHTLWILGLIEKDFMNGTADRDSLSEQQRETRSILLDLLNAGFI